MRQLILLHSLNELGTKIELCKIHHFVHILVVFPKVVFGFTNITHKMNIMGLLLPSSGNLNVRESHWIAKLNSIHPTGLNSVDVN